MLEVAGILLSCLMTLILLHSTWNNQHAPGATSFFLLMILNISWLLGSTIQWNLRNINYVLSIFKLTYLFIAFIPVLFFIFSLQFTRQEHHISRRKILLLSILPLTTQVMTWTNQYHHLMWRSFKIVQHGIFNSVVSSFGLWFWIHTAYSYGLIVIALTLLARNVFHVSSLSRRQSLLVIFGISMPLILNTIFVFEIIPGFTLDITPICFALINPVVVYGLLRFRVFDLIPIHRNELIEGISDGILVVDHLDRITDLNPAACLIFDLDENSVIGKNILEKVPVLEPWLHYDELKTWQQPQIQFFIAGNPRYYSLRMSTLSSKAGTTVGRLIIVRNITRLKESELAEREARRIAENRSSELEALSQFAGALNHATTLEEVTTSGFHVLLSHVNASAAWLILTRNLTPPILAAVHTHDGSMDPASFDSSRCADCPSSGMIFSKQFSIHEITNCALLETITRDTEATPHHLCVPLHIGDRVLGSLNLAFYEPVQSEMVRRNFYTTIAQQLSAAIERTSLFEDVQRLAITDPLTGLFNRRHLAYLADRELRRAVRMDRPLAVIMMDLDHFKQVNDLYGHMTGDRILKEIALRCQQGLRQMDLLARYGGEEFIFLLPECDFERAVQVAERLREAISEAPFYTPSDLIWVTASFGVSAKIPGEEITLENMIQEADISLYSAKATGRNNVKA